MRVDFFHLFASSPQLANVVSLSFLKSRQQVFLSCFALVFLLCYFHWTAAMTLLIPTKLILTLCHTALWVALKVRPFFMFFISWPLSELIAYKSLCELSFIWDYSVSHICKISNGVLWCKSSHHLQLWVHNDSLGFFLLIAQVSLALGSILFGI